MNSARMVDTTLLRRILVVIRLSHCVAVVPSYEILSPPHGDAHLVGFSLVGPDGHDNPSIGNSFACWDLGVVDEKNDVSTLDAVP